MDNYRDNCTAKSISRTLKMLHLGEKYSTWNQLKTGISETKDGSKYCILPFWSSWQNQFQWYALNFYFHFSITITRPSNVPLEVYLMQNYIQTFANSKLREIHSELQQLKRREVHWTAMVATTISEARAKVNARPWMIVSKSESFHSHKICWVLHCWPTSCSRCSFAFSFLSVS